MYGTLAGANTYFSNELTGTWSNYSDPDKTTALETATKQINRLQFRGMKYQDSPTQTDQFPRIVSFGVHVIYYDEDTVNGGLKVPTDVEEATYVQAKYLLDYHKGDIPVGEMFLAGVTSVSIGSTSESYDKSMSPIDIESGIVRESFNLLRKYILRGW